MTKNKEEFDPELLALADPKHDSILKPFLMITVILMGFWVISDWKEELTYFFTSSSPIELGDSTEMSGKESAFDHNVYVKTQGIPTRRSVADRYRYFSLVGSRIFVEQKRDDYIEDPMEREINGNKGDVDRVYFEGTGRLLHFSKIGGRYNGLRDYYRTRYQIQFCEQLSTHDKEEIRQQKRDAFVLYYQKNYESASPEKRIQKGLKAAPSAAELDAFEKADPVCIDAYLLQADADPKSHWTYLVISIIFGLFMLFNVVLLVRWTRRFLG